MPFSFKLPPVLRQPLVAASALVLLTLYTAVALAGWLAPYSPQAHWPNHTLAPPTPVYWHTPTGKLTWPYVLAQQKRWHAPTLTYRYVPQLNRPYPLRFHVVGQPYRLLGLIPLTRHAFGIAPQGDGSAVGLHLLGTDSLGRDSFSRLLYGGQLTLTIGFLSLMITLPLGLTLGGLAGLLGGWVDTLLMRLAEVMMSIPSLFLLVALAALIPASLSSSARFAAVVLILAFIGWAGLARVIRGMVMAIGQLDYVQAARAIGVSRLALLWRHILPQTASYVLVAVTLGVPGYLLAESGLSFLGLGIQQPDASWGNLLKEAQDMSNLLERPWMMTPGYLIFAAVLAFNVLGDALRDWLDPKRGISG